MPCGFSTCPTNVFLIFQALRSLRLRIWGKGSGQASVIKFGSSNRLFQSICHISSHISYHVISCHLCAHYLPRSIMPRLMFYHRWSDLSLFCQVLGFVHVFFQLIQHATNGNSSISMRFLKWFLRLLCRMELLSYWCEHFLQQLLILKWPNLFRCGCTDSSGTSGMDKVVKASQQASTSKGLRTAGIAGHIFWSFWFFLHVRVRANSLKHVETTPWHHHSELRITGGPVDWVLDSLLRLFLLLHPHNLAPTKCKAERKCFLPRSIIWNHLAWIISRKKIFLWTSWCFPNSSSTAYLDSVTYSPLACGTRTCSWPRRENMGNVANSPPKSTSYGRHYCNIS